MRQWITVACLVAHCAAAARFSVEDTKIGDIPVKQLSDSLHGQSAWVLPTQGGRVEKVRLFSPSSRQVRDVILTHNGNATAIKENAMYKGCILLPFANRIANGTYTFHGKTYHLKINEPERGNAIHGLLYDKELDVIYQDGNDEYAIVTLRYQFDGSDQGYPFLLKTEISYLLTPGGFFVSTGVQNEHASLPLPFYMGWHPYIKVVSTAQTVVELASCSNYSRVLVDKDTMIPTGATEVTKLFSNGMPIGGSTASPTFIDDGFVVLEPAADSQNCTTLAHFVFDMNSKETLYSIHLPQFRYIQAFTGSVSISGEQAVAIEPMSAETDAFNSHVGLTVLEAQQKWRGSFGLTYGAASGHGVVPDVLLRLP